MRTNFAQNAVAKTTRKGGARQANVGMTLNLHPRYPRPLPLSMRALEPRELEDLEDDAPAGRHPAIGAPSASSGSSWHSRSLATCCFRTLGRGGFGATGGGKFAVVGQPVRRVVAVIPSPASLDLIG